MDRRVLGAFAGLLIACGGGGGARSAPIVVAAPVVVAAPAVYDLPGDGNGIVWDAARHTLLLTDGTANGVVAWSEGGTFTPVGTFSVPSAGADGKHSLGGLLELPDGTLLSPAFGFGTAGGIDVLPPHGAPPTVIPDLDPAKRRIAIARAPDGALYETYFVVAGKDHSGGIAKVELAGGETIAITGLGKPAGLVATADALIVCDQDAKTIVAHARGDGKPRTIAENLPSCDQLTLLPNGDLITGGKAGELYRVHEGSPYQTIVTGLAELRGSAYDAAGKRLFFVEHVKGGHDRLHVQPLE